MPLTFVIPISQADAHQTHAISTMEFLGGLQKHSVLLCAAPSVMNQAVEDAARLKSVCPNVAVESLPREPEQIGKFGAFNMIFRDCVEILARRNNPNPWVWWERDCDAIRGGYADRLELEYHQKGQPFMGVRRKAIDVMRGPNGEKLPDNAPEAQGDYMVAVGIYPPNFKDYSTMYKYLSPGGAMPTDVVIRHEINRYLHHTDLIGHHYSTCRYRRGKDGRIACEDYNPDPSRQSYAGTVSDMAFVVHGVKDGSLAELVTQGAPPMEHHTEAASASTSDTAVALMAENEALRADIAKLTASIAAKENSYADEIERLKEQLEAATSAMQRKPEPAPSASPQELTAMIQASRKAAAEAPSADEIVEKPLPPIEKVKAALVEAKKSVPLLDLVADFGCNKIALRTLIESDPSLKIAPGGRAWVSLAA